MQSALPAGHVIIGRVHGFLGELTPPELADLRGHGRSQRFSRGAQLLAERQVGDRVMVLLAGRVKVCSNTKDGREVVLGFRGQGELVGELAALDGQPRSGAIVALEPVEVLTISDTDFQAFLLRHARVGSVMLRLLSERLRDADRKRIEFASADTVGRVASRLVELAERFGEPEGDAVRITLPLTQEDLAGWCGASRESTAKALHTLRGLQWIDTARRRIVVRDIAALRDRRA